MLQPVSVSYTHLKAAAVIAAQIIAKPDSVLGLATGSTPIGTYKNLVAAYNAGDLDFSQIKSANLDEYRGLTKDNDQSYYYFMNHNLFQHVNIDPANTNIPDGTNSDAAAECARYEKVIEDLGGVDLQLLGLGHMCIRDSINILQISPNRHAAGNSAYFYACRLDQFTDVHRRCLPFQAGISSNNDFFYIRLQPLHQFF